MGCACTYFGRAGVALYSSSQVLTRARLYPSGGSGMGTVRPLSDSDSNDDTPAASEMRNGMRRGAQGVVAAAFLGKTGRALAVVVSVDQVSSGQASQAGQLPRARTAPWVFLHTLTLA